MSSPKITYWFGAGASYYAVPLQGNLAINLLSFGRHLSTRYDLNSSTTYHNDDPAEWYDTLYNFGKRFSKLMREALSYGTVDILAKKLWLNGRQDELTELRFGLSVFFNYWKYYRNSRASYAPEKVDTKNGKYYEFKDIDPRYFSLLSVLLDRNENERITLDFSLNFLSYNYDLQLESALCEMLDLKDNDKFRYQNLNSAYPFNRSQGFQNNRIIHLNGHEGFRYDDSGRDFEIFTELHSHNERSFFATIANIIQKNEIEEAGSDIRYAWEMDEGKMERAKQILSETNHLIIIGYSFPSFNRRIDRELLQALPLNADITYQDKNHQSEVLESIVNEENVELIEYKSEVDQFFVPHQYFQ